MENQPDLPSTPASQPETVASPQPTADLPYTNAEDQAGYWTGFADTLVLMSIKGTPTDMEMADPADFATGACKQIWSSGFDETNKAAEAKGWRLGCIDALFDGYENGLRYFPDGEEGFRAAVEACGRTLYQPSNTPQANSLEESGSIMSQIWQATANCITTQNPNYMCTPMSDGSGNSLCSPDANSMYSVNVAGDDYLLSLSLGLPL